MPSFSSFQSGELERVSGRREQYAPDPRKIPPEVDSLFAEEAQFMETDGSMPVQIRVVWQRPRWWGALAYDVHVRNTSIPTEFFFMERVHGEEVLLKHPMINPPDSYEIAVVAVSSDGRSLPPEDVTPVAVAVVGRGPLPGDVPTFDVTAHCCDLYATWDPVNTASPHVLAYEIRQGVDWNSGSYVISIGPAERDSVLIHRAQIPNPLVPPNDQFHIKGVSQTRGYSLIEASDTLTALEIACLDAPCCTKAQEQIVPFGLTTINVTTVAPTPLGGPAPFVNPANGGGGGPGGGITIDVDGTSFIQIGDGRWTYDIHLSAPAPGGGLPVYLIEVGESV